MRSAPPGIGTPIVPARSAASSGGRYAIRAVASVAPYMTTRSQPARSPAPAHRRTFSGASRPPAWVTQRRCGRSISSKPTRSSSSNV
jgi:hypothetical protein